MKLSFVKTLEGHEIEFVRLLYPLRYDLFVRNPNANPIKLTFNQTDKGLWNPAESSELPGWVMELSLAMQEAIEENEVNGVEEKFL